MGLYDTVWVKCPHCNKDHGEQTKSGPCELIDVDLQSADPTMISGMGDARGIIWCESCGGSFRVNLVMRPQYETTRVYPNEDTN